MGLPLSKYLAKYQAKPTNVIEMSKQGNSGIMQDDKRNEDPGFIPEPVSGHYDVQVEEAWARRLPELDARSIPTLALLDVLTSLVSAFHNKALKPLGHNYTEYAILCTLLLHGTGLRPSVLTEMLRQPSANTAQTLNKLEKRGLIKRQANPEDGRSVLVDLTPAGKETIYRLCQGESSASAALGRDLSDEQLQALRTSLNTLIGILR